LEVLYVLCDRQGIAVTERAQLAEGQAVWNRATGQRAIILRADRPAAHKAIVMLHELAHIALHQQLGAEVIDTRQKEWEAESVAYIVATHYRLPTFSDLYLASWQVEEGALARLLTRISTCAQQLITQIEHATLGSTELADAA
jgi:hypothetical protein